MATHAGLWAKPPAPSGNSTPIQAASHASTIIYRTAAVKAGAEWGRWARPEIDTRADSAWLVPANIGGLGPRGADGAVCPARRPAPAATYCHTRRKSSEATLPVLVADPPPAIACDTAAARPHAPRLSRSTTYHAQQVASDGINHRQFVGVLAIQLILHLRRGHARQQHLDRPHQIASGPGI